ncbi:MAG TPA: BolA family protein [Rhizomicrobium sp.]
MSVDAKIRDRLVRAFAPVELEVLDESARHAGHTGARPGGSTHFQVRIVSSGFSGLSRLERQRAVHAVLAQELQTDIHALSLITLAPDEVKSR